MISTLLTMVFCAVPPDPWIGKGNSVAVPLMQAAIDSLREKQAALAKQAEADQRNYETQFEKQTATIRDLEAQVGALRTAAGPVSTAPDPKIKDLEAQLTQAIYAATEATQKLNALELTYQQMVQTVADLESRIVTLSAELKAKPATADERIRQFEAELLEAKRLNEDQKRLIEQQRERASEAERIKRQEQIELNATIERLQAVLRVTQESPPASAPTGREDYQPDFQKFSQEKKTLMDSLTAAQLSLNQITQERDDLVARFAQFGPEYDRMAEIFDSSELNLKAELKEIVNKLKEILTSWAQIADRPEVPPLALSRSGSVRSASPQSRLVSRVGSMQVPPLQGLEAFTFPGAASVISPQDVSLDPAPPVVSVDSPLRQKQKEIIAAMNEALDRIAEYGLVDTARDSLSRDVSRLEIQNRALEANLAALREQLTTITENRDAWQAEAEGRMALVPPLAAVAPALTGSAASSPAARVVSVVPSAASTTTSSAPYAHQRVTRPPKTDSSCCIIS